MLVANSVKKGVSNTKFLWKKTNAIVFVSDFDKSFFEKSYPIALAVSTIFLRVSLLTPGLLFRAIDTAAVEIFNSFAICLAVIPITITS